LALEGSVDPTDLGDMVATFIRDDSSHVTVDEFVRVYSESLERSEVEE
jgi:Ca2+-binding EF-hand superfamily protein